MIYKVMWIDDNPESNEALFDLAAIKDIELIHFYTSMEGMIELENNIEYYDGVILDGLVYNQSKDEKASLSGLQNSIKKLNELKKRRVIPYFIYSGYLGSDKYDYIREMLSAEDIYKKPADSSALIENVLKAANNSENTQLKHKYTSAFSLVSNFQEPNKQYERLLQLVKDLESQEFINNQQDALVPIRKLLEALFYFLNTKGLIPDEIQKNKGGINGSSAFLAGLNKEYVYKEELVHPLVTNKIKHLLDLSQDAAHNEGHQLRADTYLSASKNNYTYLSLCYSLLEVLDYFDNYLIENNNENINKEKWSKQSLSDVLKIGRIEQDENRNYHCLGYLLNYKFIQDNGYKVGDTIKIISCMDNSNTRNNDVYPLFISKFEKQN